MKRKLNRILACFLSAAMVICSTDVISFAAEPDNSESTEIIAREEYEESDSADNFAEDIFQEDFPENTSEDIVSEDEPVADDEAGGDFLSTVFVDDVEITITAEAGVFPAGATACARKVTAGEEKEIEEAVDEKRDAGRNVARSYSFDISVVDSDGKEIEPDTEKGSVKVSFKMAEIADSNLETEVYHITETVDGLNAEDMDVDTEAGAADEATVETDGFSYYTVEFTYGELQYVLEGGGQVTLKEVMEQVGLVGEPKNAVFTSPELVEVKQNEDGEWILISLQPFTTDEELTITIADENEDIDYVVKVTDMLREDIGGSWTAWTSKTSLPTTSGRYYLMYDVKLSNYATINGTTVYLDLNGKKVDVNQQYEAYYLNNANSKLYIYDTVGGGYFTNAANTILYTNVAGASIYIYGGRYSGTTNGKNGAGIHIIRGYLYMNGGTISGNTSANGDRYGGGVALDNGATFVMDGGTIYNNKALYGGGVDLHTGSAFIMNGGSIIGNTANTEYGDGAGVCLNASTFIMNGGAINGNNAQRSGGGVQVYSSTMTMSAGTIGNNTSGIDGGGIQIDTGSTFTMSGGYVCYNSTKQSGGGISITSNCRADISGGEIYENKVTSTSTNSFGGGGISAWGEGSVTTIKGTVKIYNNSANIGAAIDSDNGTVTINGGEIGVNSASVKASGIFRYAGTLNYTSGRFNTTNTYSPSLPTTAYTITFNRNGGTGGTASVSQKWNNAMTSITVPTRSGYGFLGYFDASLGGTQYYDANGTGIIKWDYIGAKTLYAHWAAAGVVTLDAQGGIGGTESVNAIYKYDMPSVTLPTRAGYTFAGYFDAKTGGNKYYNADGSSARVWTKTTGGTLYAQWTGNICTVSLDDREGLGGDGSVTATFGEFLPDVLVPTLNEYRFVGYFDAASEGTCYYNRDGKGIRSWDKEEDAVLYAHWVAAASYAVSFDNNGHGVAPLPIYDVESGSTITKPQNPADTDGWEFAGWYKEADAIHEWRFDEDTVKDDITLYARWISTDSKWIELNSSSTGQILGTNGETSYYRVSSDVICTNSTAGGSGLSIASGATVYIYTDEGASLTCKGANGSGTTGGGAGIWLPESATLYLMGEGYVNATGGKAASGLSGGRGGDAYIYTYNNFSQTYSIYTYVGTGAFSYNGTYYNCSSTRPYMVFVGGGAGGKGGNGGGGAGAGIGTPGGVGGNGGAGSHGKGGWADTDHYFDISSGVAGQTGAKAANMGTLRIATGLTLEAVGGTSDGLSGGAAGGIGSTKIDKGVSTDTSNYNTAGGGGGGGGGGAGYSGANIGTGGQGGSGGGGGNGAGTIYRNFDNGCNEYYHAPANGGKGGAGSVKGANGSNQDTLNNTFGVKDAGRYSNYHVLDGGYGGPAGSAGTAKNTEAAEELTFSIYFKNSDGTAYGSDTYTVGDTATITLPDYFGYKWKLYSYGFPCGAESTFTALDDILYCGDVPIKNVYGDLTFKSVPIESIVTLIDEPGTGGSETITVVYGESMPDVSIPQRDGYSFDGYFDAEIGGTQYYYANGSGIQNWMGTEIVHYMRIGQRILTQ